MPTIRSTRTMATFAAVTAVLLLAALAPASRGANPGTNPFTDAVARFNADNGKIESVAGKVPSSYVPSQIFYEFCSPPGDSETNTKTSGSFLVAKDGKLTGTCEATRSEVSPNGMTVNVTKEGTLTGQYDLAAQTVTFRFEGSSTYSYIQPPTCEGPACAPVVTQRTVVVEGPVSGGEVVGDRAEGTARHTYTCAPSQACIVASQVGTAKFAIQFQPPLPGGGTGGAGPAGTTSPGTFLLLLVLAGASAALIAAAILFLRRRAPRLSPAPSGSDGSLPEPLQQRGPTATEPEAESPFAGATASGEATASPFAGATAAGSASVDAKTAFAGASASAAVVPPPDEEENLGEFMERMESATENPPVTPEDIDALSEILGGQGSSAPPASSTPDAEMKEDVDAAGGILGGGDAPPAEAPAEPAFEPSNTPQPGMPFGTKREGGPLGGLVEQTLREHIHPAVGADRSGGFEGQTSYGEGADHASPAASKAYEADVVASSKQASGDEPLVNDAEKQAERDARDSETDPAEEGR